jgi:mannose-6-phosphate isomerase-like protein (cupin superfamily)
MIMRSGLLGTSLWKGQTREAEQAVLRVSTTLKKPLLLLCLLIAPALLAQQWKVDPTWLHRYVPSIEEKETDFTSKTCHYKPVFGEGDKETQVLRNVVRFGEVDLDNQGICRSVFYERQEEIYFVLEGRGTLHYGDQNYSIGQHDFTYLPPGVRHAVSSSSGQPLRMLAMSFKIPLAVSIGTPSSSPRVANLDTLKAQTVEGHPKSVLYKLLVGPRTSTRNAINAAYVVTSFFWMDFARDGTNFPHHHESAEEIYLILDGEGEIVAGGGIDGVEGRHPAKAGDAYYFRPNCTVGFYNQNQLGANSHILAVRSQVALPEDAE